MDKVLHRYLLQMVNSEYLVYFQFCLGWVQSRIPHLNFPESFSLDSEFIAQMLCLSTVINELMLKHSLTNIPSCLIRSSHPAIIFWSKLQAKWLIKSQHRADTAKTVIDYLAGSVLPLSRARHWSPAAFVAPLEPRAGQHVPPELQPLLVLAAGQLWCPSPRWLTPEKQNILNPTWISEGFGVAL